MNEKFVINIGRQLGSGGREIGEKLAAELNISYYDKELIELASQESGLCKEFFEKADEKASQGLISGLFGMRFPFVTEGAMPYSNCLSNDALFKIQSDVIRKLAEEKSCLFVGRCADYILRDNPRCVNIFISASLEDRIERVMSRRHITREDAEALIEKEGVQPDAATIITTATTHGELPPRIIFALTRLCWELRGLWNLSRASQSKG